MNAVETHAQITVEPTFDSDSSLLLLALLSFNFSEHGPYTFTLDVTHPPLPAGGKLAIYSIAVTNDRGEDISPKLDPSVLIDRFTSESTKARVHWSHDIDFEKNKSISVTVYGEIQTPAGAIPIRVTQHFDRDRDFSIEPSYQTIADI